MENPIYLQNVHRHTYKQLWLGLLGEVFYTYI